MSSTAPGAPPHAPAAPVPGVEKQADGWGERWTESKSGLFFRVFPSICLPMFLASVDQTIVATALPAIAGELGDVERIGWIVVSYLVATTVAAPVYGRLGDAMGRRRLLFVALFVFIAASVLCAVAPTIPLLALARVLQGLGGGGLMTLSQALIGEVVPPRERGRYQGYMASVFMVSSTFGPVAGGWLTQHMGWRSVFLVNLPFGALALLLALRLPKRPAQAGVAAFDTLGLVLFTGFVAPLLLALEQAQHFVASVLPGIAALVAFSLGSLWLLLRQERRVRTPLIPVGLLRQSAIWRLDTMASCVGATLVAGVTFMPIYLQVVRGAPPETVGWLLLPLTAGVAGGSLLTGRMIGKTGRTAIFPSIGLGVVTVLWLVMAFFAPVIPVPGLSVMFLFMSMALGTAMPVVQMTVQHVAGPKNLGAASASVQFSRSIGAALGTAIVSAVLFATLAATDQQAATLFADVVERGPAVMAALAADHRQFVQGEIAQAFRMAFLSVACFTGFAWVLAWTVPVRRLF